MLVTFIKSEEEVVEEYGKKWREIFTGWTTEKNILLGQRINKRNLSSSTAVDTHNNIYVRCRIKQNRLIYGEDVNLIYIPKAFIKEEEVS
jgi:hypothetical protein